MSLFKNLISEPDTEWEFIDGSDVKAHQHSAGARGADSQAIGKSRAENTTKIHLAVDSDGLPIEFTVTGGEIHDSTAASELIEPLPPAKAMVADKGYDSEKIREQIRSRSAIAVTPRRSNSVIGNADMDWSLYRHRPRATQILIARTALHCAWAIPCCSGSSMAKKTFWIF